MVGSNVSAYLVGDVRAESERSEETFVPCASQLRGADILFGNLESVINDTLSVADVSSPERGGSAAPSIQGARTAEFGTLVL